MVESPLSTALFLHSLGYRAHPLRDKRPFTEGWNTRDWGEDSLRTEFDSGHDGVGLHLRGFLDLDCDGDTEDERQASHAAMEALALPETVAWTSTRGLHRVYQLTPEQVATLSAATNRQKFVYPGSHLEVRFGLRPETHLQSAIPPSGGREWLRSLLEHEPATLPSIDWILAALPKRALPTAPTDGPRGTRPGDAFNRDGTWEEILEPLGYRKVGQRTADGRTVDDWLRPGSDKQLNATTGYCQSTFEDDKLYVFSSSWAPFEQDQSYTKFEAWALTRHDGDYTAAARDLAERGYQSTLDPSVFDDLDDTLANSVEDVKHGRVSDVGVVIDRIAGTKVAAARAPREAKDCPDTLTPLLSFPGFVERVAAWHLRRAHIIDARAGAIAGILTASWMLGRRVRLFDGTRPNIAILATGTPGGGKTEVEGTVASLVDAAGFSDARCQEVTSGPALEDVLADNNNLLLIRDEIQDLLANHLDNIHLRSMMERMKRVFSSARSLYIIRKRANEKVVRPPVIQPNLALLLIGVPSVWTSLDSEAYHDGFMARLLAIDIINRPVPNTDVFLGAPPQDLVDEIKEWRAAAMFSDNGREGEQEPVLREIPCTPQAQQALLDLKAEWLNKGDGVELYLYRRGQELTCKLALIAGATGGGEIDLGIVDRARSIVEDSISTKLSYWQRRGYGDKDFMELIDRVYSYVEKRRRVACRLAYQDLNITVESWRRVAVELIMRGRIESDGELTADGSRFAKFAKEVWIRGCGPAKAMVE